nr:MAG TPA: hypothetical protein [Bacteriophage sp.]
MRNYERRNKGFAHSSGVICILRVDSFFTHVVYLC